MGFLINLTIGMMMHLRDNTSFNFQIRTMKGEPREIHEIHEWISACCILSDKE
jgi:hypothetical protein